MVAVAVAVVDEVGEVDVDGGAAEVDVASESEVVAGAAAGEALLQAANTRNEARTGATRLREEVGAPNTGTGCCGAVTG